MWLARLHFWRVKYDLTRDFLINMLHVVPVDAIDEFELVFGPAALNSVQFAP